jgi:uncharacterized membrane protein YkvI
MKKIIKTVYVIIGTIVGAGFASGKEIYSFFFIYGYMGIVGIIISSLIIGIVIYAVLEICKHNNVKSFEDFCMIIQRNITKNGKVVFIFFNMLINVFLLIMFYVMISGFSGFLRQELNIPTFVGSIFIAILCYITFRGNIENLIKISNYLMPVLIIFMIYLSVKALIISESESFVMMDFMINKNIDFKFIALSKSILYASYNCIGIIPVITQLYVSTKQENTKTLSIMSSLIILVLSFCVYILLLQGDLEIFCLEMPIIGVAKQIGCIYGFIYTIIIGIAIYTSAASCGIRIS